MSGNADLFAGICVVVPTFNNARTLEDVLERVEHVLRSEGTAAPHVIVVDDGSTDDTPRILGKVKNIHVLRVPVNRGKGNALRRGFDAALKLGFRNAITIDSDGQHDPADLPALARAIQDDPDAMIMGARDMDKLEVPGRSSFGNRFSNFWFKVETGITLPDTQTGYRGWPLKAVRSFRTTSDRFGFEVESIVKLAWRGTRFHSVPVTVRYDYPERVSHFKPFLDFTRISLLNTWLVIQALLWYWPKKVFFEGGWRAGLRAEAVRPDESSLRKALSIGFGLFMGIVPIWGFQLLVGIPLAYLFRLNRVLFVAAAHISIPPMIPVILYASYLTGALFTAEDAYLPTSFNELTLASIHANVVQYAIGALVLATAAGLAGLLVSWPLMRMLRRR